MKSLMVAGQRFMIWLTVMASSSVSVSMGWPFDCVLEDYWMTFRRSLRSLKDG